MRLRAYFLDELTEVQARNANQWIGALRSGAYVQGQGCLRSADPFPRYCCLGVAAENVLRKSIAVKAELVLSDESAELMGLRRHDGGARPISGLPALTELNDSLYWTLAEIADLLEADLDLRAVDAYYAISADRSERSRG